MDPKPGYKTTEFWLSSLAIIVGLLMSSGILSGVAEDSITMKIIGGVVAGLTALGYQSSRTKAKVDGTP